MSHETISDKIHKWIPSKNDTDEVWQPISKLYSIFLTTDFTEFLNQFKIRLKTINYNFTDGSLPSGAVCFFGSIFMSMAQMGYIGNLEELFTLSACYILLDHYLDDKTVGIEDKVKTINQIKDFINGNSSQIDEGVSSQIDEGVSSQIDDPILKAVADRYMSMVASVPTSEPYLKNLFKAEVKTMMLQRSSELSYNEYLHICEWKGGLTCEAIQALIGLEVTQAEYDLGACIQLVDDMMDVNDDMDLGIHTIVTHSYGNNRLKELLEYIINRLDGLDSKYNLFKPILYTGLLLAIHTNKDKFSLDTLTLLEQLEQYIHFNPTTTKESLVEWFQMKIDP